MEKLLIIGCDANGNGGYDATRYLVKYTVSYEKLWGSDSGRNMDGDNKGTLIGIFPKLEAQLGRIRTTAGVAAAILQRINQPSFHVKYYDAESQTMRVASMYAGSPKISVVSAKRNIVEIEPFSIISNSKRR